jgi:CIC family chloride channel protein
LFVAVFAALFLFALHRTKNLFAGSGIPLWLQPAVGGLALGILATGLILWVGSSLRVEGQGLGILGGGYGAVQMAISGSKWLPEGWRGAQVLALLAVTKIVAASFTIGSGGSAGDFAPSLAIGGLVGGAFGRAAQLLLEDPRIDPGAFELVGMGAFYGGIAHAPLSALVLVCEMAGNYDLLVPLMLSLAISYVALRRRTLYEAQVPTIRDSPVHRDVLLLDIFRTLRVRDVMVSGRAFQSLRLKMRGADMLKVVNNATWQGVFPVEDEDGRIVGMVTSTSVRILALEKDVDALALAADVMQPVPNLRAEDDLRSATELLVSSGLRELPVMDSDGRIVAFLDEADVARLYLKAASRAAEDAA